MEEHARKYALQADVKETQQQPQDKSVDTDIQLKVGESEQQAGDDGAPHRPPLLSEGGENEPSENGFLDNRWNNDKCD